MLKGHITETKFSNGKKDTFLIGFKNLREFNDWVKLRAIRNKNLVKIDGTVVVDFTAKSYGAKVKVKGVLISNPSKVEKRIKQHRQLGNIAACYNEVKRCYDFR